MNVNAAAAILLGITLGTTLYLQWNLSQRVKAFREEMANAERVWARRIAQVDLRPPGPAPAPFGRRPARSGGEGA